MPSERPDWWSDAAEMDAVLHGSDLWDDDDRPSRADLADDDVPTRPPVRGPGRPFEDALQARREDERGCAS